MTIRRIDYDRGRVERGYHASGLDVDGGVLGEMFHRTVMTGQPWVSDFNWWVRQQPPEVQEDPQAALAVYDAHFGPGRLGVSAAPDERRVRGRAGYNS